MALLLWVGHSQRVAHPDAPPDKTLHTMEELVNILAENYATAFSTEEDALLQEINKYTLKNHPHAHMLSGKVQGNFLTIISRLLQPKLRLSEFEICVFGRAFGFLIAMRVFADRAGGFCLSEQIVKGVYQL